MSLYLKKGGIAVFDQVLFAGSNFLMNIFLAKFLAPSEYGVFGMLYSIYLFILISVTALLLEPFIYYYNTIDDKAEYVRLNAGFTNWFVILSLIAFVIGFIFHDYFSMFLSYILITNAIFFYKRYFLAVLTTEHSLLISFIYFVTSVLGLYILFQYLSKTLYDSFLILYLGSLATAFFVLIKYGIFKEILKKADLNNFMSMFSKQKKYAFHCFISNLFAWLPSNIYFLAIPVFISTVVNARFKALQNLNLPLYHINIALVTLLVPFFIRSSVPQKLLKNASLIFICLTVIYLGAILIFKEQIQHYLYSDKYTFDNLLLASFVAGIVPEILSNIYKAYFRAKGKPEIVSKINFRNCIFCLFGIVLVFKYQINGVIASYILVNLFNFFNCRLFYNALKVKST